MSGVSLMEFWTHLGSFVMTNLVARWLELLSGLTKDNNEINKKRTIIFSTIHFGSYSKAFFKH